MLQAARLRLDFLLVTASDYRNRSRAASWSSIASAGERGKAINPAEFERVIGDTTLQEKVIAHPAGGRLLEVGAGQDHAPGQVGGTQAQADP